LFTRSTDENGIDPGFITKSGEENEKHPGSIRGESGEHSILVPIPNPPPLPNAKTEEEEEEVRKLVKILRAEPYRVNEAATAVQHASDQGCTLDEIRAIATHWGLAGKWSSAQLWTRIDRAKPGEYPTGHWPPPDAAKQRVSRRGTGDPETDAINREYLERERIRRANRNQAKTPESLAVS
jgi:hypothetical protein